MAGSAPGTPPGLLSHPLMDLLSSWTSKDSKLQACNDWDSSDDEGISAPLAPVMQPAVPLGSEQIQSAGLTAALGRMAEDGQQALPAAISISPRGPMLEALWEQAGAADAAMATAQLAPGSAELLPGVPMQPSVGAAMDVGQTAACCPARNGSAGAVATGQQVVSQDAAPDQQADQHAIQEGFGCLLEHHNLSGARPKPTTYCPRPRRSFVQWLAGMQLHDGCVLPCSTSLNTTATVLCSIKHTAASSLCL